MSAAGQIELNQLLARVRNVQPKSVVPCFRTTSSRAATVESDSGQMVKANVVPPRPEPMEAPLAL